MVLGFILYETFDLVYNVGVKLITEQIYLSLVLWYRR